MKQAAYEKATYQIINMINSKKQESYNDHLFNLLEIMLKENILEDIKQLSFYEFFELSYNCLHVMLKQCEQREDYEICAFVVELIENEDQILIEWIKTLPTEEERDEMFEQFEHLKITMKIINEQY
jgi:hypothetical protein